MSSSAALTLASDAFRSEQRPVDAARHECAHCTLPVPAGLLEPGAERQFCCQGCRSVYSILHDFGLERYYRLRAEADGSAGPARVSGRRFEEFDDPAFRSIYCRLQPGGLQSAELFLEGVHCAACVWLIEKLPRVHSGVVET
jgi:Cu2+-exporting ATPase